MNDRRIWVEVPLADFMDKFDYAVKQQGFSFLCTITGLDEGEYLAFIYHLAGKNGVVLNIKTRALKDKEIIKTVTDYFPCAAIYERELVDLFGAKIEGLPEGIRYPLPDDWPIGECPLRKDWDPSVLDKKGEK